MHIHMKLFGPFRTIGETIDLNVPSGSTADDLPAAMTDYIEALGDHAQLIQTLAVSRFATETSVLARGQTLTDGMQLAVIPPVAGG